MTNANEQVWFITGANKGIGAVIAREALGQGYKVVATARNAEGMETTLGSSPNLLISKLDLTIDDQVQVCAEYLRWEGHTPGRRASV